MGEGEAQGPAEEIGEELREHGLAEPVLVRHHGHWHRVLRITRLGILIILGLALIGAAFLWIQRKPIANRTIAAELEKRGVQATYTLDRVGLRTQEISNVVIGDPKNPDLVAEKAIVLKAQDDVAIAKAELAAGTVLEESATGPGQAPPRIEVRQDVKPGHKVARHAVRAGQPAADEGRHGWRGRHDWAGERPEHRKEDVNAGGA